MKKYLTKKISLENNFNGEVRIYYPELINNSDYFCKIEFIHTSIDRFDIFGVDEFQAMELAIYIANEKLKTLPN